MVLCSLAYPDALHNEVPKEIESRESKKLAQKELLLMTKIYWVRIGIQKERWKFCKINDFYSSALPASGGMYCGSVSHGKKTHTSWSTLETKVSTLSRPIGLA